MCKQPYEISMPRYLKGSFGVRKTVAVSKLSSKEAETSQLLEILPNLPCHSNVVAFFHAEPALDENFHNLALEMCSSSLEDYKNEGKPFPIATSELLLQITTGLKFLHDSNIVHQNMKPTNILFIEKPKSPVLAKLCNFGFTRPIFIKQLNRSKLIEVIASKFWQSPEFLKLFWNLDVNPIVDFVW